MSDTSERSRIYHLILEAGGEDEFICMFAYAIYKKQKMQEIQRLQKVLGRSPTNVELKPFVENAEIRIDAFLKLATDELAEFQQTLLGNYIDELSNAYEQKFAEAVEKFQPQKPPSWFKSAVYGLAGNILTAFVTVVLTIIALFAIKGFPGFWQTILPYVTEWAQGKL